MHIRTEELSKWMPDGGSQISHCWKGNLQIREVSQIDSCGNGLQQRYQYERMLSFIQTDGYIQKYLQDWGCSSIVECTLSMLKALGSIYNTKKKGKEIFIDGYTHRVIYTHIFPCFVSLEGLEATAAQQKGMQIQLLVLFSNKGSFPWRNAQFQEDEEYIR